MSDQPTFLFSRNRVDKAVNDTLAHITRAYCRLTGRDNFSLFRGTFVASALACWVSVGLAVYFDSTGSSKSLPWSLGPIYFLLVHHVCLWIIWRKARKLRKVADRMKQADSIYFEDGLLLIDVCGDRLSFFATGFALSSMQLAFQNYISAGMSLAQFLLGASLYFATHFTSGGTSAYARAKEKLRELSASKQLAPAIEGV